MIVAKIVGHVVSTNKAHQLTGAKLLVVQPLNMVTLQPDGKPLVSIDTVGSGVGETVMVVGGSSARQTNVTKDMPVDSAIVGVLDYIEIDGKQTYKKS